MKAKYLIVFIFCVSGQLIVQSDSSSLGNVDQNKVIESGLGDVGETDIFIPGIGYLDYNIGQKIGDDPIFKDTVNVETSIDYLFVDEKVPSNFKVKTIKAPKLNLSEPLEKIHKRYVALGVNDFSSAPFAQLNYTTLRNRKYSAGFEMDHISQKQGVGAEEKARYGNSNVALYGKKFYENKTLYGSGNYSYDLFNFYGVNKSSFLYLDEDLLTRGVGQFDIEAGLKSRYADKRLWGYDLKLNYNELSMDSRAVVEHRIDLNSSLNKYLEFNKYDWLKGVFNVDFTASYLNSGKPITNHESFVFNFFPTFDFKLKNLDLIVGGKAYYQTLDPRRFTGMVYADADFAFVKDVLHIFARLQNDYQRISYIDYMKENPFVVNYLDVVNKRTPLDFRGGIKGAFSATSSFNLGFKYIAYNELPLYYNVGNSSTNQFEVLTDEVTHRQGFVEFVHEGKKLNIIAKGEYNLYDVFKYEAFHLPNLYGELRAAYNMQDKFVVGTDLFLYGKQLGLEGFDGAGRAITKDLNPIFDFNIDLRYNYSKKLGAFLKTNNILNTKHVRWDQYATYGINFLVGVDYNF